MLEHQQDGLNLNNSIHPITGDPQQYRRLREEQQQRYDEHANFVQQATQMRRTNERQQFRERMQKCPIGMPAKRLSPRTPPLDFKLPMPPNQSPLRSTQWSSNEQPVIKKSSPDPSLMNVSSTNMIPNVRPDLNQQFTPPATNPYRQMGSNFMPPFQDPRIQLHQQQQFQAMYAQQFGGQFPMSNGQQPQFNQMPYGQPDLLRFQMLQQQQQWAANQQLMQGQFLAQQASVNTTTPMNKPIDQNLTNPMASQMNGAFYKQNFWPPNQQQVMSPQFETPARVDSFNSQLNNAQQLNFIPPALAKSNDSEILNGLLTSEEPETQNEIEQKGLQNIQQLVSQNEDDMFDLYSTINTDGVEQDLSKYLANISNIETYNFAQLDNADAR